MSGERQNILLITSDQQHWNTLGIDNPEIRTPHLDRLARSGVRFTRAYCPNPTCTPSRASILTGRYPSQHGAYSLGTRLPEEEATVGALLGDAGYATGLIGKAHFQPLVSTPEYPSLESYPVLRDLDFWRNHKEPFYGFEHIELARNHADEPHVGQHYALWMEEKGFTGWREHFQNAWGTFRDSSVSTRPQSLRWSIPEAFHYNTWIAERSEAFLEGAKEEDRPFFLWSSFFDPHPPYLVPEPWDSMYDPEALTFPEMVPGEHRDNPVHFRMTQEASPDYRPWEEIEGNAMHGLHSHLHDPETARRELAVYYGMVSCMDKYIGRILDRLEALDLVGNTTVVFTSDHGHFLGHHGLVAKGPFHYEDLVRVPMIVRSPGGPSGVRSESLQSLVDLAPSFLDCAGLAVPRRMSGVSQRASWRDPRAEARDHVVVENRHQPTTLHLRTYIDRRYKITIYFDRDEGELFDLEEDPGEVRNLWDQPEAAGLKTQMLLKLAQAELGKEPLLMPRIAPA